MCCGCVFSLPRCFGFALGIGGLVFVCVVCVILQAPARSSWVCFMLVRKFVQGSPSDSVGVRWPFVFSLLWSVSEAYRSAPVFPIHGVASHVVPSMCRVHSPARAVGKCRGCIAVKKQDSIELGPVIVSSMHGNAGDWDVTNSKSEEPGDCYVFPVWIDVRGVGSKLVRVGTLRDLRPYAKRMAEREVGAGALCGVGSVKASGSFQG